MPFGLLEIALQVTLAIHAYRTGRTQPWLYLILFLPGIGSLLYIALELAPELLRGRHGRRLTSGVAKAINPGRRYRELQREVQIAPTVYNKTQLAEECLALNLGEEAAELYRSCANGLHDAEPGLRFGLARALSMTGDYTGAAEVLEALRRDTPKYRAAEAHLMYAAALNGAGQTTAALQELAALVDYYPGEEARCRYAQLLLQTGASTAAEAQFREIIRRVELQRGGYRQVQREWYDIARRGVPG